MPAFEACFSKEGSHRSALFTIFCTALNVFVVVVVIAYFWLCWVFKATSAFL